MKNCLEFWKLKYLLLLPLLIYTAAGTGVCQNIQSKDVVSVNAGVTADSLKSAGILRISVALNIKDGWHINANKPLDNYLTPTSIALDNNKDFKLLKIKYPPPLLMKLGFSEKELALYEDEITVSLVVKVLNPKEFKNGMLKGYVRYQPCNNHTCLFPVSKDFTVSLKNK